jgi:hypothetical protein
MVARVLAALLLSVAVACAGKSSTEGGTGGSAGTGAGGGLGGSGGTSATGGSGGTSTAGAGGSVSPPPGQPECETADDCVVVSDCCGCRVEGRAQEWKTACPLQCQRDACAEDGLTGLSPICSMGRCRFDVDCDPTHVSCRAAAPTCPSGELPSVNGSCWGPCVDVLECNQLTGCGDCPEGSVCVIFQAQRPSYSCVTPQPGCTKGNYCACLAACGFCTEEPDVDAISCDCPVC